MVSQPRFTFTCHQGFDDLPPEAVEHFSQAWEQDYFLQPRWYAYVVKHFVQPREEFCVWLGRGMDGTPAMLFPARRTRRDPNAKGALCLQAASHWENAAPLGLLFNERAGPPERILTAFFAHLKSARPDGEDQPFDVLRFWPVDPRGAMAGHLLGAFRRSGFRLQPYQNSLNQFEDVRGQDFDAYLESRSKSFRYNLGRKRRKLERGHTITFDYHETLDTLADGLRDHEAISLASWKRPSSLVGPIYFDLIQDSIAAGVGILSIMRLDGHPVSTQFWIVTGGVGHIVRLAYDKAYEKLAVGIVHNEEMIRTVMGRGPLREISYGYGGEAAKEKWTREKRHLYGLMAFNRRTAKGLYFGVKNIAGSSIKHRTVVPLRALVARFLGRK